jgi:hypothetical protein
MGLRVNLLGSSLIVWLTVSNNNHGHDHDYHIHPDGKIRNPAESLQSPYLAKHHTQRRPDYTAYDVADVIVDLVEALSVANDDNAYQTEQLD